MWLVVESIITNIGSLDTIWDDTMDSHCKWHEETLVKYFPYIEVENITKANFDHAWRTIQHLSTTMCFKPFQKGLFKAFFCLSLSSEVNYDLMPLLRCWSPWNKKTKNWNKAWKHVGDLLMRFCITTMKIISIFSPLDAVLYSIEISCKIASTFAEMSDALYFSAAERIGWESFCWERKKECSNMRIASVL